MSSIERLAVVSAPFVWVIGQPAEVEAEALGWLDSGLVVRGIRGRKSRVLAQMFDEFAAALQFPLYFGENWAAFRDCVGDLAWLPFKPGVAVIVYGAEEMLADAHPAEMTTLVQTLNAVAGEFGEAVADGEWWDRDPVPFHVVLQGQTAAAFDRWREAGAVLDPLT